MGNRPEFHEECVRFCRTVGLQERIEFLGSRTDVPDLLEDSDAFVYASVHDTFGIALGEAMASGLPVVVNDLPVFREIFGRYDSVAFTRSDSPAAMAERIQQVLSELPIWRARAQVNAQEVRNRFSMGRLMGDLDDLYLSLPKGPVARLDSGA
jgi:glycosyltransferase involved in cell wall biosynthesis